MNFYNNFEIVACEERSRIDFNTTSFNLSKVEEEIIENVS